MQKLKLFLSEKNISWSALILVGLTCVLLFIISLPHSMALRKLLIFIIFIIAFKPFWDAMHDSLTRLKSVVLLALALQLWMLVISGFIAPHPLESFMEWKGQWLPVIMCLITGIGLARTLMWSKLANRQSIAAILICAPIALFLGINALVMIKDMLLADSFLTNQIGITDEKGITNYLIALIEPILVADLLARLVKGKRLLPIPNWAISAFFALAVFSLFAASSRNGLIVMMLALMLGAVMMITEFHKIYSWQRIASSVLLTFTIVAGVIFTAYKTEPRWQGFVETIPIAWDIDHDLLWLKADAVGLPKTSNGTSVDPSQYYRIAWLHEGWRMLLAHPWGIEISRDTFHQLELGKHGHAEMSHSHNGWIDLGLNVGVLGMLLWGGFLWLLARTGWQSWQDYKNPLGLALTLMTIMFVVRAMLDSVFRNHIIEQFALVAGLIFTTILYEHYDESKPTAAS
jgi:O-Antigen ligase